VPFTAEEKTKIRHHMGYLGLKEAQTFVLGTPAGVETQFIIEGAMDKVSDDAIGEARRHLVILDGIESQMIGDLELLAVDVVGEITIRKDEQERLLDRYDYWRKSLGNLLSVYVNPFDKRPGLGGGVNVPVRH